MAFTSLITLTLLNFIYLVLKWLPELVTELRRDDLNFNGVAK